MAASATALCYTGGRVERVGYVGVTKKFQQYRELHSLQEYVLIAQDSMRIEHYLRQGEKWILTDARGKDAVVALPSLGCALKLSDVYAKVEFEE